MTNTERQQKIKELEKEFDAKRMELAWIQTEIMALSAGLEDVTDDLVSTMGWPRPQPPVSYKSQPNDPNHA